MNINKVPVCSYCPLERCELDDSKKALLRNRAAQIHYGSILIGMSDVSRTLAAEEEVTQSIANSAVECLHKIMRHNCPNVVVEMSESGKTLMPKT